MPDGRNDIDGYDEGERPQRYRIRELLSPKPFGTRYEIRGSEDPEYELGEIVERVTIVQKDPVNGRWYHSIQEADQLYADLCSRLIQRACGWFYDKDWVPLLGAPDIRMTDAEIADSIHRLNHGENRREGVRMDKPWYDLESLPLKHQRCLIEQLYALREKFGFLKLGPVD